MDLRQSKRYRLKASVSFCWQHSDGSTMQGEGYTRDISPSGVFVLTTDRLLTGTEIKLEVTLPSLREKQTGASLRTHGHVVRSDATGFAAVAEMGFQMRLTETSTVGQTTRQQSDGQANKTVNDVRREEELVSAALPSTRFCM